MEVCWHYEYLNKKTEQTTGRGKESIAVDAVVESPSSSASSLHF